MNGYLKPKHTQSVNDDVMLWFEVSNQYTIVANGLFYCIQIYLEAKNEKTCIASFQEQLYYTKDEAEHLFQDIQQFLEDNNIAIEPENIFINNTVLDSSKPYRTTYYVSGQSTFKINFQPESLLDYIHPQISHLETNKTSEVDFWFDILEDKDKLILLKNNQFVKACKSNLYNQLQGKFNMELICSLHNKKEHDWIGLFHASTVSNTKEAVMLIGQSGSGKSTLTTILSHSGYELIADDNTPLLRDDVNVYHLPNGISTKQGALETLKSFVPNLDLLENSFLRAYKGPIKYIPTQAPIRNNVPCNTLLLVNYQKDVATQLEKITAKDALEILIPDSWISPKPKNAKAFLNWVSTRLFLKLTYSNNEEAIAVFSTIFKSE